MLSKKGSHMQLLPIRKRFRYQLNLWTGFGQNLRKYFKRYKDAFEYAEMMKKQSYSVRGPFDLRNSDPLIVTEAEIDSAYRRYHGF